MIARNFYYVIDDAVEEFRDDDFHKPMWTVAINVRRTGTVDLAQEFSVAMFGDDHRISMFKIRVPAFDEASPEKDLEVVQTIKETMIAVLHFTYDHKAEIHTVHFAADEEEDKTYSVALQMRAVRNEQFQVQYENIRSSFVNAWPIRYDLKLLSYGTQDSLPLEFRYLSLYKLLELNFKAKGKWNSQYDDLLATFTDDYAALKVSKLQFKNYVEHLRDRCAHIKSKRDEVPMGITMLNNKDATEVNSVIPIMIAMCTSVINNHKENNGLQLLPRPQTRA